MNYQETLINTIFDKDLADSAEHSAMGVYHNNYIENGIRALTISFSTVAGILDEADFRRLARDYLLAYPKQCFDWADYGSQFAEFMFDIDALMHMPFLPELAELDWRLMHLERTAEQTFDGASFGLLQSADPATLQFVPSPGLQLMRVIFPMEELYALVHAPSLNQDTVQSQAARQQHLHHTNKLITLAIKSGEYRSIVLYRKDYKGLFEYTSGDGLKALQSMLAGHTIATVLAHFGDDQAAMTEWLQAYIQTQKIYGVVPISE